MQYPFALMFLTILHNSVFPILTLKKMRVIIPLCESLHAHIYSALALRKITAINNIEFLKH